MTQMKNKIYLPSTDNLAIKMPFLKIKGFLKEELFTQCFFSVGVCNKKMLPRLTL